MKKIFFSFLLLFMLPTISNAATLELTSSSDNVAPGKNITITINAKDFNTKFGSIHFDLSYDDSKLNFVNSKALQGSLTEEKKNGKISITIQQEEGMDNGKIYQLTLSSVNTATSGISTISIFPTNDCFDLNLSLISVNGSNLNISHYIASTIDTLSSLSVSNCELSPKFSPDTLNYTCPPTNLSEVTVTGSITDSKAKVIGLGVKTLEYGNNNISVIVIAENGSKKKYNINITRNDIRNENNTLSNLEVVGYNINFNPLVLEYNLDVLPSIDKITINATTLENTSTINGIGEVELKSDYNSFFITVQAENGGTKVYRINVIKKEGNTTNTLLSFLSFNDIPVKLTDKKAYLIGVTSDVNSLNLKYETTSSSVLCEVEGNDNLKEGINVVKIIIKAKDIEDTTYTLIVYKESKDTVIINDFTEINSNAVYNNKYFSNVNIPSNFISSLIDDDKYFKYNIVNEYNGLLASFKFNNNNINDDLEVLFSKMSNNSYSSNIPSGVLITLYIDNSKDINIYNYNEGTYSLVDTVTPTNGYIEFISNGSDNYVFSEEKLFNEIKKKEVNVIQFIVLFIAGIIVGIILHYYLGNNRKNKINLEFIKL